MLRGPEAMVCTQVNTNQGPEPACRLRAAIYKYVIRDATLADGVFNQEKGQFGKSISFQHG